MLSFTYLDHCTSGDYTVEWFVSHLDHINIIKTNVKKVI